MMPPGVAGTDAHPGEADAHAADRPPGLVSLGAPGRMAGLCASTSLADLPVSARRDDIAEAIQDHQVVIVAGETGSGKTTQLPKICLALGRGRPASQAAA